MENITLTRLYEGKRKAASNLLDQFEQKGIAMEQETVENHDRSYPEGA